MRKRICRFAAMRRTKFRLLNCQSCPQDSETAGINGIINFINELRQICESVSAVVAFKHFNHIAILH